MQPLDYVNNSFLSKLLISPGYRAYRHLLLILSMALIAFNGSMIGYLDNLDLMHNFIIYEGILLTVVYCGIAYLNVYILIPRILLKNRYFAYIILILLIMLATLLLLIFGESMSLKYYHLPPNKYSFSHEERIIPLEIIGSVLVNMVCLAGSSISVLMHHWITTGTYKTKLEQTNLKSELERLKNQISPHFLFRTLENSGQLVQKFPAQASGILMRLSRLLRYQLYDSTRDKVLLSADIQFLENFLELEKEQNNYFDFKVFKEGNVNQLIPPLLFIPFVEFFTGQLSNNGQQTFIHLTFKIDNQILHFTSISPNRGSNSGDPTDFQELNNVRRRLNLLYGQLYKLSIVSGKDTYIVNLQIPINE